MNLSFRSKQEDFPLQASKWLQLPALLDASEMRRLFESLPPLRLFRASGVLQNGQEEVLLEEWLQNYEEAVSIVKARRVPPDEVFRKIPLLFLTNSTEAIYLLKVGEDKNLLRSLWPVVEMKWHRLSFSSDDFQFRSQLFGKNTFFWGVQFSYPQLIVNPLTKDAEKVDEKPYFSNTPLFKALQKWLRAHTHPTPFIIGDKKINVPARIGIECFSWINQHPQLIERGIHAETRGKG